MPNIRPTRALHIPAQVLACAELSLLGCAVFAEVLDLYRVKGHVFADDEHFAMRCHVKPRTVRETISELVELGFLIREVNYKARHKRTLTPTERWQNLPAVVADSATTTPGLVADSATTIATIATIAEVPAESAGSSGEICRDLWQNLPGVVADSANINTIINTKTNTIQTLPQKNAGASASASDSLSFPAKKDTAPNPVAGPPSPASPSPLFEVFWDAYDKKVDKLKSQQRWGTLKPDEQQAAIAKVPEYVEATSEKHFRKNPLTWLNGKCWLDEEPPPQRSTGHDGSAAGSAPPPARATSNPNKLKDWS